MPYIHELLVVFPNILYYGNPSGEKNGKHKVPTFHGLPGEEAIFEEVENGKVSKKLLTEKQKELTEEGDTKGIKVVKTLLEKQKNIATLNTKINKAHKELEEKTIKKSS